MDDLSLPGHCSTLDGLEVGVGCRGAGGRKEGREYCKMYERFKVRTRDRVSRKLKGEVFGTYCCASAKAAVLEMFRAITKWC